jgi:polyisoprenoid-binding protein YceI
VKRYPEIRFTSTSVEPLGDGVYKVTGNLGIHGETRSITFEVETAAPVTDPWGNLRAGATVTGKLNRKDWGLTWNQALELGALYSWRRCPVHVRPGSGGAPAG